MNRIWIILILISSTSFLANGQKIVPLYDGLPPNSLPLSQADEHLNKLEDSWITKVFTPSLTIYLPEKEKATGIAVVICPGGGYFGLAMGHEGYDIAKKLQENGIAGIVLKYRLPKPELVNNKEIVPLQDAEKAMQYVREHASEWGIDPHKIGLMGSSAGGHLASTLATHYQNVVIDNPKGTSLRPDFLILNYPVISFADGITHNGSRYSLVGELSLTAYENAHPEQQKANAYYPVEAEKILEYSNDLHVSVDTPPTFIHSAVDDQVVPVANTLLFISALQQHQVLVTSFFYAKGGHGYGMNVKNATAQWIDQCIPWVLNFK